MRLPSQLRHRHDAPRGREDEADRHGAVDPERRPDARRHQVDHRLGAQEDLDGSPDRPRRPAQPSARRGSRRLSRPGRSSRSWTATRAASSASRRSAGYDWRVFFIGGMWFQDLFNYDFRRTEMCIIPYATQMGEISFCAYNTGVGWRKIIEEMFQTASTAEWYKTRGRHEVFARGRSVPLPSCRPVPPPAAPALPPWPPRPSTAAPPESNKRTPLPAYGERLAPARPQRSAPVSPSGTAGRGPAAP